MKMIERFGRGACGHRFGDGELAGAARGVVVRGVVDAVAVDGPRPTAPSRCDSTVMYSSFSLGRRPDDRYDVVRAMVVVARGRNSRRSFFS